MSNTEIKLTLKEQIERAIDGRSQKWIVLKMKERGLEMNEVAFSNKKNMHSKFTEQELFVLSEILGVELQAE